MCDWCSVFFYNHHIAILLRIVYSFPEYFDRGNYNLFFVDWSELARAPCYPSAAHNTKYAGECIGQLVNRIHDAGSGGENIHLIGFSLGAHVAAFAANHAKKFKVRRITGTYIYNHIFSIIVAKNHATTAHVVQFIDSYHLGIL